MLKNNLVIAFRNLTKSGFYSIINISGLAIGIASCLIIVLYLVNELGYDRHFKFSERIFRVNSEIKFGSNHYKLATGNAPLAELLVQSYPEIETVTRIRSWGPRFVRRDETADRFKEAGIVWADSIFFKMFSVAVLKGNASHALNEPNSVAISRHMADKYFPNTEALGQSLILDDNWNHKVTAVFKNIPSNSHFHFDILVAMSGLKEASSESLVGGGDFQTYLLLKPGTDEKRLESKLPGLVEKHEAPQIAAIMGGDFTLDKFHASGNKWAYTLTPLVDIHLHSDLLGEFEPNGSITYVYLFSVIALFILFIACINFMNLSTARSSNRSKEVGVRKVMGSLRSQLVRQFLTESFLISLFSVMVAFCLSYFLLPVFNDLALKQLTLPLDSFSFYGILFFASIVIGLLAGLYPAFFLSAFKPVSVLKGPASRGMKSGALRSTLVVFQFVISIFLIIGTIAINRQLHYIQHKEIGFEKDQVIVVKDAHALGNKIESFKTEILKNNFIKSGTISGFLPVSGALSANTFWKEGVQPSQESMEDMVSLQTWYIDPNYLKTFGMKIKLGRGFLPDFLTDSSGIILNETALKRFDLGNDPLGKKISSFHGTKTDGTPDPTKIKSWTVIGVVEDFHFESLKQSIAPLSFFLGRSDGNVIFRYEAAETKDVIDQLEKTWKDMAPGQTFQYSFLDEDFGKMYASEQRLGKIFTVFAGLAIIIACLGLFALTSFTAEQRTKEIGIRKVLGATVNSIVFLLSREFGKLIVIAFLLASPLAYYAISWWLKDYSYKVEVNWNAYLLGGVIAFVIAWITLSYQSFKAAIANPASSLKSE